LRIAITKDNSVKQLENNKKGLRQNTLISLYSKKNLQSNMSLKQNGALAALSTVYGSTSRVSMCFSSASYTTCSKQKSTLRTSSAHSFSTLNILFDSTAKASANIIFRPFSKETGELNEKQQVATFWSRLGSKLTNQKTVVFPERSSSRVENQMARLKCTKWLDH